MKTFSEFITEVEVKWHTGTLKGSGKSPFSTASQKLSQLGRKMSDPRTTPQQMSQIAKRVKGIKTAIGGAGEVARVSDPRPENRDANRQNTKISGYASKPRDTKGSSGSLSGVGSPSDSQEKISGRYGNQLGQTGSRGTGVSRTGSTIGTRG